MGNSVSSVSSTPSVSTTSFSTSSTAETAGSMALYTQKPETAGSIASMGWIA